jgi:hypothetical protein
MELRLITPDELTTTFSIPKSANADVSLRRIQYLKIKPGQTVQWQFGRETGEVQADEDGLITIPGLNITEAASTLLIKIQEV